MSRQEARRKMAVAKRHLKRVLDAATEQAEDPEIAVTFGFYAYECGIVALAELHGRMWSKNHSRKAQLARDFYADGTVSRDIDGDLEVLNDLRKDVAYNEPGPELYQMDLKALAHGLERFVGEIESQVVSL